MKAVILAAGKGTRMGKLSEETPKPMLTVLGKTLLEHKLDSLPESIKEVVITVGYLKDKIVDVIGNEHNGRKITYVEQKELLGTAHALFACKEHLVNEEKFLVMMGDDIYSGDDMKECLDNTWSILIRETDSLKGKAKVIFDDKGHIIEIIEKYQIDEQGFICSGMYGLTPAIFDEEMVAIPGGEYGLPQTILSAKEKRPIKVVQARFWLQITAPEDLTMAEQFFEIEKNN
ncbi:MAG: nucleotidyltransferase family protein [Candidatus Paceibacterota bacterium]